MSGSDEAVAFWLSKAEAALASARSERAVGRFDFAVNRAYYAAFYGATGVLLGMGMRFAKHSGVRRAIHRDLVKAGRLPTERGHAFDQLFKSRQTADYLDFARFTPEEVDSLIAEAEAFVAEMRRLVAV